jgi:hypothetical protein
VKAGNGTPIPGIGCGVMAGMAWLVGLALALSCLPGCGAAVLAQCEANEQAIVDRPCGELDDDACLMRDQRDLAVERARCDAAMAGVP